MLLTKEQILAVSDRKFEEVEVPEWGGKVRIGTMSALARDEYERLYLDVRDGKQAGISVRAHLVAACIVDESGNRIFTGSDVQALSHKCSAALVRLFDKCIELNALTDAKKEDIKGE